MATSIVTVKARRTNGLDLARIATVGGLAVIENANGTVKVVEATEVESLISVATSVVGTVIIADRFTRMAFKADVKRNATAKRDEAFVGISTATSCRSVIEVGRKVSVRPITNEVGIGIDGVSVL